METIELPTHSESTLRLAQQKLDDDYASTQSIVAIALVAQAEQLARIAQILERIASLLNKEQ